MLGKKDILEYMKETSPEDAANLLLLTGPDGFDGTVTEYHALEDDLLNAINTFPDYDGSDRQ